MKAKIIFVILMIVTLNSNAQLETNSQDLGLKGKVKSLLETEFQIGELYGKQNETRRSLYNFNENGNKIYEKQMDPSGAALLIIDFKYDNTKLLQEKIYNSVTKFTEERNYQYNNSVTAIKSNAPDRPEALEMKLYYDANNNVVKKEMYEANGKIDRVFLYKYSGSNKISEQQKAEKSEIEVEIKFTHDDNGNVLKREDFDSFGKKTYQSTYKYDKIGNMTSESSAYTGEPDSITITYKYTYDQNGNWTERSDSMDGKQYSFIIRRITY